MKDLFDLKKGYHNTYSKPQKFFEIYSSGSYITFKEKTTYAVWHHSKRIKGKTINIFHFQSEDNKGTRSFDWWLPVTDVCMTIKDALILAKTKRIETSKERLVKSKRIIKLNNTYLKNYSNFEPTFEQSDYEKRTKQFSVNFYKLDELRKSNDRNLGLDNDI